MEDLITKAEEWLNDETTFYGSVQIITALVKRVRELEAELGIGEGVANMDEHRKTWEDAHRAEFEQYKARHYGQDDCNGCSDRDAEIEKLKEELEDASYDLKMALIDEQHLVDAEIEIKDLQRQLAEARAEVERLKQLHLSGRYTVEQTATGVRICYGHHEKHEPCEYSEFIDKQQARQEAAREIILMMTGATFEGPNKAKFEKVTEAFIGQILKRFGLEG